MVFTIVGDAAIISGDCANSRAASVYTGGNTDDAYAIDALAIAETAANRAVGTITAWVMPGDITSTAAIVSFNDANVAEYIDFKIVAGKLCCAVNDNTTPQFTLTTDAVTCPAHKWTHVAIVQNGVRAKLYVNGVMPAQTFSVSTDTAEWFVNLDGVDKGFIGASSIGGAGAIVEEFVGGISDVQYYSSALTDAQVLADYNGASLSTGRVAWYNMMSLIDGATGGGTYDMVAVSDVYLIPTYNEFISLVRKFGAVVADVAGFTEEKGRMSVLFINAA